MISILEFNLSVNLKDVLNFVLINSDCSETNRMDIFALAAF